MSELRPKMGYKANCILKSTEKNSLNITSRNNQYFNVMAFFRPMIQSFYSLQHKSKAQLSTEFRSFSPNKLICRRILIMIALIFQHLNGN